MEYRDVPHDSGRDAYMVIILLTMIGLPLFVLFNVLTMGIFIYVAVGGLAVAGLGAINYFLWGRSLQRNTAWEREEAEILDDQPREDS
jgi:hypothetical protein